MSCEEQSGTVLENFLSETNVGLNNDMVVLHLDFLEEVDKDNLLTTDQGLRQAIHRYEQYWLPLVAKYPQEDLAAPRDIAWVWYCHVLSPADYEQDCLTYYGRTIPHKLLNKEERLNRMKTTETFWIQEYPDGPFVAMYHQVSETLFKENKFHCNLVATSAEMRTFYYNVSLPHYRDPVFIQTSIERYKKFLFLLNKNIDVQLDPAYDIALIWNTHKMDTQEYESDIKRILGKHPLQDITKSDKQQEFYCRKLTRVLWRTELGESCDRPGSLCRGESTRDQLHKLSEGAVKSLVLPYEISSFDLSEVKLTGLTPGTRIAKLEITIPVGRETKVTTFDSRHFSEREKLMWRDDDLRGSYTTDTNHIMRFSLRGVSGYLFAKKKYHIGWGELDCIYLLHTLEGYSVQINHKVELLPSSLSVKVKGKFEVHPPCHGFFPLKVHGGIPKDLTVTFTDRKDIWGPTTFPTREELSSDGIPSEQEPEALIRCRVTTNRITYMNNMDLFTCKVIHSVEPEMSAVLVYKGDNLLAHSQTIDLQTIPLSTSVEPRPPLHEVLRMLSLDPSKEQHAMLVSNNRGDWGLVLASYQFIFQDGYDTIIRRKVFSSDLLYMAENKVYEDTNIIIGSSPEFCVKDVYFKGNNIELLRNHNEAAENIALALSLHILHEKTLHSAAKHVYLSERTKLLLGLKEKLVEDSLT